MDNSWITISEACVLLGVSRPTLNNYRAKYKIREIKFRGKVHFSKIDLIKKIILNTPELGGLNLTSSGEFDFNEVEPIKGIFDFRKIDNIDAFGIMTLLCAIKEYLNESDSNVVHLILDNSFTCSYLHSIGFFNVITLGVAKRVVLNHQDLVLRDYGKSAIILPINVVGYRGAEKKILDELFHQLFKQGFTEDYCGHIGWAIGELCDNAHTHSRSVCYLVIEAVETKSTERRLLSIAIGDVGIGIQESLRENPEYADLNNQNILAKAFQTEVSRMNVEPKRGKGLNDIISIAKGNGSWLRVDSNENTLLFDFREKDEVSFLESTCLTRGTRFNLMLNDAQFVKIKREIIDQMMQDFMGNL